MIHAVSGFIKIVNKKINCITSEFPNIHQSLLSLKETSFHSLDCFVSTKSSVFALTWCDPTDQLWDNDTATARNVHVAAV